MNINTIIEEEIERLRDLYLSESPDENGAVTTSTTFSWATFDITQKQEKIAYYLMTQEGIEESFTTAMQRAYEAGEREANAKWERVREFVKDSIRHAKGKTADEEMSRLLRFLDTLKYQESVNLNNQP